MMSVLDKAYMESNQLLYLLYFILHTLETHADIVLETQAREVPGLTTKESMATLNCETGNESSGPTYSQ